MNTQKPVGEVINIEYNGINYSGAHIARYKAMLAASPEIN